MKVRILTFLIILCCAHGLSAAAQDYVQVPVTVSKEKVRNRDGKVCWSHVVQERQTLYSISHAYGVSIDDICAANPDVDLRNGLKKNSIILIPIAEAQESSPASSSVPEPVSAAVSKPQEPEYVIHIVKWFENLEGIAKSYGVTVDDILKVNDINGKLKSRTKLRIPLNPGSSTASEPDAPDVAAGPDVTDPGHVSEPVAHVGRRNANVVIMLPFNASGEPSGNSIEFYSGALLAAKELGDAGYDIEMSVYDVAGGKLPITEQRLSQCDMVVGPIASNDLARLLDLAPSTVPVISPLDPKAESLAASHSNLIHAPTPAESQYLDMISWIGSDMKPGDKALMISEKGAASQTAAWSLKELVRCSGLGVNEFSYGILEGRDIANQLAGRLTKNGTNRVIIASESEAFVNDVVRNLNLMVYKEFDVVLYSPSKIRSYSTIEVENLHKVNLHASLSYYIDYKSKNTSDFLMKYRALFNSEPTQFSFQGYDIVKYCISSSCEFGSQWKDSLPYASPQSMLQSTFDFNKRDGGIVNGGIRRVVYEKNYNIGLVK